MKEQSHKEEMSSVLKADFARLRARGVTTTLAPVTTPAVEAEQASVEPEPVVASVPDPASSKTPSDERPEPAGGWLRRLLNAS